MSQWFIIFLALTACAPKSSSPNVGATTMQSPPLAEQQPHTHTEHGVERPDPYYWLRDREDPNVIAYLEAENAYVTKQTEHLV